MVRLAARRALAAVPLALAVATLVFFLMETAPGSPADLWLGDRPVPPDVRDRIERAYGLDRPAPERYLRWLGAVGLRGELGWSHSKGRPVRVELARALPPTLWLSGAALLIHVLAGVGLGIWAAASGGRAADRVSLLALVLYAMPTFWLGLMAILLFSVRLGWFPPSSMTSVGAHAWPLGRWLLDLAWHTALPAGVLGLASASGLARFVRSGTLDALAGPFVRAARARGLRERHILVRHALRNALIPVVNLLGLSLPILVSGSLVIEVVFAWPGMGRLTYDAILARDHPVVLGATLLASAMVIAGNLCADLAMAALDPRIRAADGNGS